MIYEYIEKIFKNLRDAAKKRDFEKKFL